eukprot:1160144-Pelagomonas_calceolata.AAC.7
MEQGCLIGYLIDRIHKGQGCLRRMETPCGAGLSKVYGIHKGQGCPRSSFVGMDSTSGRAVWGVGIQKGRASERCVLQKEGYRQAMQGDIQLVPLCKKARQS